MLNQSIKTIALSCVVQVVQIKRDVAQIHTTHNGDTPQH